MTSIYWERIDDMEQVRRIYVEKKDGFDVEARGVLADLRENLVARRTC